MGATDTLSLLLYAVIGISGALALVVFVWGIIVYAARLGTERRVQGIRIMEWGVALILTSVLLIGALRFTENLFS
jgi:hypothetical protein